MFRKNLVPLAFAAACLPALWLAVQFKRDELGANPIDALINDLGYIAFVFLMLTLACTPLQIFLKLKWPLLLRKLLGDFCFFYASVHLCVYAVFDQGLVFRDIVKDMLKHKFLFLGFGAWLLMLPLAVTSTEGWKKRLGFRRWKRLHRAVYLCGGLASFHFLLRFKTPHFETVAWLAALGVLLLARAFDVFRRRIVKV